MLSVSGLIGPIQSTLNNMEKLNFTPFIIPYTLKKTAKKELRFEACKKYKSSNWIWQFFLILLGLSFTTYKLLKEATSNVEKAVRICHIIGFPAALIHVDEHRQKSDTFVSFLNGLLCFETTYLKRKSSAGESKFWKELPAASFARNSILAFKLTLLPLPVLITISDTVLMKSPWFLLPQPLLEVWNFPLGELVARAIVFVFSYSFWRVFFNMYLILTALSSVTSFCGLSFVNMALQKEQNRLQTSDHVDRFIRKRREAKLLCSLYNEVHQRRIIPSLIIVAVAGISVFLYTLVAERSHLGLVEMIVCLQIISAGIMSIFCAIGLAANVFASSKGVNHSSERNNTVIQTRLKKYWKSFPTLKVCFGQGNYIDRSTPLVIFNFAIDITVNLILLK